MNVYDKCLNIIKDKDKLTYLELNEKWDSFKTQYPQLYNMLTIDSNIDLNMLKFMCEMSEKQTNNKEENLNIEIEIGDRLANKYLYNDKFKEPTNEQKEFIKNSLKRKLNN